MTDLLVCRAGELKDGDVRIVGAGEVEIGVYRHDGRYFAYRNRCFHQGGPVCEGIRMAKVVDVILADRTWAGQSFDESDMHIVCPWHGYEYRLETGECASDAKLRLQAFKVVERDGQVFVAV
jgi:nitrite reductase/ring-hydroxylating ferredoxin subunit